MTKFLDAARSSAGRSANGRTSDYTRNNTAFRSNLSNGFKKQFDKQPFVTTIPLEDLPESPNKKPDDIESFFGVTTVAEGVRRVSYEESIHDGSSQSSLNAPTDPFAIVRTTDVVTTTESRSVPTKTLNPIKQTKAAGSAGDNSSVHQLLENKQER